MSRTQEHIDQWKHNRQFIQTVDPVYCDWIVTAAFYLAVHAIEALLTADGARSRSRHQDRHEILQSEARYERIYRSYKVLYDLAHVTRYSAAPARWVPSSLVQQRVIKELVYPIENSVRKLLAASKLNPPVSLPEPEDIRIKSSPSQTT